jgi:hypothetical protein
MPIDIFPSGLQTKIVCVFLIHPMRSICPVHLTFIEYIIISYSLCTGFSWYFSS